MHRPVCGRSLRLVQQRRISPFDAPTAVYCADPTRTRGAPVRDLPEMDYRLRVTPWARGISLRVTVAGALEVVAPRRYSPRTITRILRREAAWIQTAQANAAARRQALPPTPVWRLPLEISLPAVGAALDGHGATHGGPRRSRDRRQPGWARRRRPRRRLRRVPPRPPAVAAPAGPGPSPAPVDGGEPRVRPLLRKEHGPPRPEPLGELLPPWRHLAECPAPAAPAGARGLCPGARALPHPGTQPLPGVLALGRPILSGVRGPSRGVAGGRGSSCPRGPSIQGNVPHQVCDHADAGRCVVLGLQPGTRRLRWH